MATVKGFRWLIKRERDNENYRAFVRDMAENHLPHLYACLSAIAKKLDVEIPNEPLIYFIKEDKKDGNN